MTLTELRYAVAVAEHLHFGRASEACFVAQPTLSLGVKKLEDRLGVLLFERGTTISVTEKGAALIEKARQILSQARELQLMAAGEAESNERPHLRLVA